MSSLLNQKRNIKWRKWDFNNEILREYGLKNGINKSFFSKEDYVT